VFEPKKKKMTGGWRKLQNVELYVLLSSPNSSIIRMIKYRAMRWVGHVSQTRKMRNGTGKGFFFGKPHKITSET
jgi:hypothetical protein